MFLLFPPSCRGQSPVSDLQAQSADSRNLVETAALLKNTSRSSSKNQTLRRRKKPQSQISLSCKFLIENGFWYTLLLNLPQYVLLNFHRPLRPCHSRTNIPSHTLLMKPNGTEATNKIFVTGSNLCTCLSQQDCWLGTIQQEIKHPYKST